MLTLSVRSKMMCVALYIGHPIETMDKDGEEIMIVRLNGDHAAEVSRPEFDMLEEKGYIRITGDVDGPKVELTFDGRMSAMQWGRALFGKKQGWRRELARERRMRR